MSRLSLVIIFCLMTACQHRVMPPLMADIPLPDSAQLPCCWQAQESLEIDFQGKQFQLNAAIAVERKEDKERQKEQETQEAHQKLTLVLFNPLGQRMLTITQQGDVITTTTSPELNDFFPPQLLLTGIHMAHTAEAAWPLKNTNWNIKTFPHKKELLYKGDLVISLTTEPDDSAKRVLYFADHEAVIRITTLMRLPL